MSSAAVQSEQAGLSVQRQSRWKWTSAGLTAGTLLILAGFPFKNSIGGVLLEFVGFVVILLTLVAFLLLGLYSDLDR